MTDKTATIAADWKALLVAVSNGPAIQRLVDVLGLPKLSGRILGRSNEAVQGVANDGPTDYFRRMLAEHLAPEDVRDQEVLQDITRWNVDRGGPMLDQLFEISQRTARYVDIWEYFAVRIETPDLYELSERLFSRTLEVDAASANMEMRPALLAAWRRLNRRERRRDASAWLDVQIGKALPVSLRFADDLLYYWAGSHGVIDSGEWSTVRRGMLERARVVYRTPNALMAAVADAGEDNRQAYALLHFVRPPHHRDHIDIEPQDREWLAPLLISAAALRPEVVVRNLISMVGDTDVWARLPEHDPATLLERIYQLRSDHLELLFGEWKNEVLKIIANHPVRDDLEKSAAIQAARLLDDPRGGASQH